MKLSCLFLLIILLFSFVIFTYHLKTNPPGFYIDESIYGFEAYSLLTTGRSSNGELFPRLILNPGETVRNHTLFAYLIVPLIALGGHGEFYVRLVSVISSVALETLLFFLLKNKISYPLILAILIWWPVTSWVFLLSRIGMEFMASALIFTVCIFLIDRIILQSRPAPIYLFHVLGAFLFLLFFIYAAGKILAPGLLVIAVYLGYKRKISFSKISILFWYFILIIAASFSYIWDGSFFYRVNELSQCPTGIITCFTHNLLSHLSPLSYFGSTYLPPDFRVYTHSITGTSLLPWILSPFLFIGLIVTALKAFKNAGFFQLLILSALLGMIPASLTLRGFDSYRSVQLLPLCFIFCVYGLDFVYRWLMSLDSVLKSALLTVWLLIFFFVGSAELHYCLNYEFNVQVADSSGWQYGARSLVDYFVQNYSPHRHFYITPTISYPTLSSLYIRFFDPQHNFPNISTSSPPVSPSLVSNTDILYALRPQEITSKLFTTEKVIYYPDHLTPAFFIGHF